MAFVMLFSLVFSHWLYSFAWQRLQVPQAMGKDTTTRWPVLKRVALGPVESITPQHSWPRTSPFSIWGITPEL
jgi:hypothetical protein